MKSTFPWMQRHYVNYYKEEQLVWNKRRETALTHPRGENGCNLCLRLRARSRTIYVTQFSCSIFQPDKFEQTCAQITTGKYFNDATAVTITVCLHVSFTHHIIINLWICRLFSVNIDVLKSLTTAWITLFCDFITLLRRVHCACAKYNLLRK